MSQIDYRDTPGNPREAERSNMRSLALQLRRNSHQYRRWAHEHAASGHKAAADVFANRAARYAADALWYWRRGTRNT